ncbi:MAG: hypothetical protein HY655_08060 [Acidobacteria bacterium]|nr:hypothetical protein [Acidobacteriota bacterium]
MQHDETIRHLLQRVRSRWRALRVLQASMRAALATSAVVGVALIAVGSIDRAPLALAVVAAAALLLVVAAIVWAGLPLRHVPDDVQLARYIEERAPALDDRLASAVDLARSEPHSASPALAEPMLADAVRRVTAVDIDTIVPLRSVRRAGAQSAAAACLLLALSFMARGPVEQAADATSMALFPSRVSLEVTPGSARIKTGTPLAIQARLLGTRAPVVARVEVAEANGWRPTDMTDEAGLFRLSLPAVTSSFKYRVVAGTVTSPEYDVTVARAPRVERIDVEYRYPAALGLQPRTEEDGGDIYAPAGTDVRIRIHADRPAATAQLALADGRTIALSSDGPTSFSVLMKVMADNSYRVAIADSDGLSSPGDTEYFIRMLEDRPPEVRIVSPATDRSVTSLEEVEIEAEADDDYSVSSLDLVYAVRGGAETVVPLGPRRPTQYVTGRHTLYLEDLQVRPGDFVSYYVRARDVVRGNRSSETKSDIYFLEVKPFEQDFRLAQSQAQSGGSGNSVDELVHAQKEIVVATWKLDRRAQAAKGARSEPDIRAVSRAEAELKTRVEQTASTFREATMRDPRRPRRAGAQPDAPKAGETLPEEDAMTAASTAMGKAIASLDALKTGPALPPEMEALNHLLKAQAAVKRREVSRQAGSGNGNNNQTLDMSSLFDKELQRQQETNYETTASAERRQDSNDSTLEKIKELARRQDELLKQQQDLAKLRERMTAEELKRELEKLTREQSELRQQAEELSRQMNAQQSDSASQPSPKEQGGRSGQSAEQRRSGQSSSGSAGSQQMREVSEQMRSAASDLRRQDPEKASAGGSQALEKLRELERQMQAARPDEQRRALGETQLEARHLADAQWQLASELGKTAQGEAGKDAARRLAGEQERLAERAQKLQENLKRQAAGGSASSDSDRQARTAARDAVGELEKQQLAQRMQQAANDLRGAVEGSPSRDTRAQTRAQEDIARSLDRVADGLQAATGSRDGETQKLSAQLARAQELRDRMSSLSKEMERLGGQTGKAGTPPGYQKSADASGKTGEGQQAGGGGSESELSRLQQEYSRQLEKTRELVDELKREDPTFAKSGPGFTFEGQGRTMSAPGTEAFKQDFAGWEILRQQATAALDQVEASLSKRLQTKTSKDRLAAGVDEKTPPEYDKQVDSYFKALAAAKKKK